jgi:hypothetical protein
MKTRRTTSSSVVCEACETRRALRPQPERIPDDTFQLCQRCSDRLERLSLRPLEWYNLAKRHGPHGELLSREYYSPGGIALMSDDEMEEEPHILPAPALRDVAHDLHLLWDHTFTRREIGPKLLAAWRRHPKADVAALLTKVWDSREDSHTREHLLTLCRDCLGRAGAALIRQIWDDYYERAQDYPTTGSFPDDDEDHEPDAEEFTKLIDRHLKADEGEQEAGDSPPRLNQPPPGLYDRLWPDSRLPSASARCLPRDEAFQRVLTEVERFRNPHHFIGLRDPRVLDWMETHLSLKPSADWGHVAAACRFSWGRALLWLERGPPLSHIALDALENLITRYGDPLIEKPGVRLLDPPSRRTLSRVLKAHALRDPDPGVEDTVAFILENSPVLLEGKPYEE